jgi:hypothetical protein
MNRACDAIGCNTPTASGRFMCRNHWRMVPLALQRVINQSYREHKGLALVSDVAYVSACVDAIDGIAKTEGEEGVNPYRRLLVLAQRRASNDAAPVPAGDRVDCGECPNTTSGCAAGHCMKAGGF